MIKAKAKSKQHAHFGKNSEVCKGL